MDQVIYLVTLIGLRCSFALGEFSHFYYTAPYIYQAPLVTNQGYQYSTGNAFFSRSFSPVSTFYYTQGIFAPQEYTQRTNINGYDKERSEEPNYTPAPSIQTRSRFVKGPLDEFRGFAYHTTYNDGASSNVIFVTGPEARQIQNIEISANTSAGDSSLKSRTLITDLTSNENIPSATAQFFNINDFFKNPISSIQNFYSRNEKIFADNQQGNYPASTAPLKNAPVDINTRVLLKSTEDASEKTNSISDSTSSVESTTEKEVETAESVVENIKVNSDEAVPLMQTSFSQFLDNTTDTTAKSETNSIVSIQNADKLPASVEEVHENSVTLLESTTVQQTSQSKSITSSNQTNTTDSDIATAPQQVTDEIARDTEQTTIKQ